jgi:hypothetical protein
MQLAVVVRQRSDLLFQSGKGDLCAPPLRRNRDLHNPTYMRHPLGLDCMGAYQEENWILIGHGGSWHFVRIQLVEVAKLQEDRAQRTMQKWEHVAVKIENRAALEEALRQYSNEGWELVTVATLQGTSPKQYGGALGSYEAAWHQWDLFFKRPKQ